MKLVGLILLVLCLPFSLCAVDSTSSLEAKLKSGLEGKVVTLRNFYEPDVLNFDARGELLGAAKTGPWTVYSKLRINAVQIAAGSLELEASRLVVRFNDKGAPELLPLARNVKLQIVVANQTVESVKAAIDHIFVAADEHFSELVPDYWRAVIKTTDAPANGSLELIADGSEDPGPKVVPPRPVRTTEVEYTDAARDEDFEGKVLLLAEIGTNGRVGRIEILHPAGLGLDDQAVAGVRKWTFKPATRNGRPVAVPMRIEFGFKLFVVN